MGTDQTTPTETINNQLEERKQQVELFNQKKKRVSDLLDSFRGQITQALPSMVTPDRMIRVALTAMNKNPKLLDCTGHSLISCIMTCSQLGLMPDEILGEAYLIPFNNTRKEIVECTVIIGYKGLCTLAMRSGQVQSISAFAVYAANTDEGDIFDYDQGLEEKLVHKPSGLSDASKITHFYAIVRFLNGGRVFQVMTRAQVEAVRNESANYKFSNKKDQTVWAKYFPEMGCKTVLRKTMKYVPMSPEVSRAISLDEAGDYGKQNTSYDFTDIIPEFADDITHEIVGDQQTGDQMQVEEEKSDAVNRSAAAISETERAISSKANQRVVPKKL